MATIDELVYPDAQQEADAGHLRARARQTLRLLRAVEIAAFQEFGGSDRLLVASNLGIHELSYRPATDDPSESTVTHALTRWPNVKGVEMVIRYARAESARYAVHVSVREPNFQASASVTTDASVPLTDFGSCCVAEIERYATH